jgi:hypothetical protein
MLPGVLLCVAITTAAVLLQAIEVHYAGQPYLEALVLAILLGVAIRTAWTPGPLWRPGIGFSAKYVLEFAIVMLGASVSVATIVALGPFLVIGIASIVAIAIGSSYAICRVAFEGCDALLEHGLRRIHDPRVDVAEFLQREQVCGMLGRIELVGRRLIDRHCHCGGSGIPAVTGMQDNSFGVMTLRRHVCLR